MFVLRIFSCKFDAFAYEWYDAVEEIGGFASEEEARQHAQANGYGNNSDVVPATEA